MAYPSDLPTVTVRHRIVGTDGTPARGGGRVTAVLTGRLWTGQGSVVPTQYTATVQEDGTYELDLPPVDHPDIVAGRGEAYLVTEPAATIDTRRPGRVATEQFHVAPTTEMVGQTVDVSDVLVNKPKPGGGVERVTITGPATDPSMAGIISDPSSQTAASLKDTIGTETDRIVPAKVAEALADDDTPAQAAAAAVSDAVAAEGGIHDSVIASVATDVTADTGRALGRTFARGRETMDRTVRTSRSSVSAPRPLVSLIDDDGNPALFDVLKPIALARGIPVGAAIIADSTTMGDPARRAELLELQNEHGWEVLSHTMTHINISQVTPAEYAADCEEFLATTRGWGFDVENIVYPWGTDGDNKHVTARYYLGGFTTGTGANRREEMDTYGVNRIGIGSMMGPDYQTLDDFKALVDRTKANNEWLVLMSHIGAADAAGVQLVEDVLDYALDQGLEFVAPRDGLAEFGAIVHSGRKNFSDGYFHIKPGGIVDTSRYVLPVLRDEKGEDDPPEPTSPPFVKHLVWPVTGWSLGSGIVTEYGYAPGWQRQEFRDPLGNIFVRRWAGTWTTWRQLAQMVSFDVETAARTIPPHSTIHTSTFPELAQIRYTYTVRPHDQPPDGLLWEVWSHGNRALRFRIANITPEAIELPALQWTVVGINPGG